jgi:Mn-dependent DtxR family transcriptional regulator
LDLTQENLAAMLGVRRTSVTLIAATLQERGLISYRRGHLHVQNVERLKTICCECYGRLKLQQNLLLFGLAADQSFPQGSTLVV